MRDLITLSRPCGQMGVCVCVCVFVCVRTFLCACVPARKCFCVCVSVFFCQRMPVSALLSVSVYVSVSCLSENDSSNSSEAMKWPQQVNQARRTSGSIRSALPRHYGDTRADSIGVKVHLRMGARARCHRHERRHRHRFHSSKTVIADIVASVNSVTCLFAAMTRSQSVLL